MARVKRNNLAAYLSWLTDYGDEAFPQIRHCQ